MNLPRNTKPWIQGAVVGAIAATIVGFVWGGWVTGGTYTKDVAQARHDGAVEVAAQVCAARFAAQPDAAAKTKALRDTSSWDRGNQIEKAGFATMPGEKSPDSDIARACAALVTETANKT